MSRSNRARLKMTSLTIGLVALGACRGHGNNVQKLAVEPATVVDFAADDGAIAWVASGADYTQLKLLDRRNPGAEPTIVAREHVSAIALSSSAVYWEGGNNFTIWSSPRTRVEPKEIARTDDVPKRLIALGDYVYWATPQQVARVSISTGTSDTLLDHVPVAGATIQDFAVDGSRVVVAIGGLDAGTRDFWQELWEVDGAPRRIARDKGTTERLLLDGDTIFWSRLEEHNKVSLLDFSGSRHTEIAGRLVAERSGTLYVDRQADETFEIPARGDARGVAPRALHATIVGTELCGVFLCEGKSGKQTIGCAHVPAP